MQPASTIPVIELEDAIHMNSYREFVLSNDDESITIDEAENAEYVKSKVSGEHWYHTSCIKRYRTLGVERYE